MNLKAEELRIAKICIGYLSFPGFEADIPSTAIMQHLSQGYYAFLEYALIYWGRHLERAIPGPDDIDAIDDLSESVQVFLDAHWIDSATKQQPLSKGFLERLRCFKGKLF